MDKIMKAVPDNVWKSMQADISEIKVALLGNEYNPKGALYQIGEHEKSLMRLEDRFNKVVWMAAGAGTLAGFVISIAFKVLPLIVG